jgi:hypothetical protein
MRTFCRANTLMWIILNLGLWSHNADCIRASVVLPCVIRQLAEFREDGKRSLESERVKFEAERRRFMEIHTDEIERLTHDLHVSPRLD